MVRSDLSIPIALSLTVPDDNSVHITVPVLGLRPGADSSAEDAQRRISLTPVLCFGYAIVPCFSIVFEACKRLVASGEILIGYLDGPSSRLLCSLRGAHCTHDWSAQVPASPFANRPGGFTRDQQKRKIRKIFFGNTVHRYNLPRQILGYREQASADVGDHRRRSINAPAGEGSNDSKYQMIQCVTAPHEAAASSYSPDDAPKTFVL